MCELQARYLGALLSGRVAPMDEVTMAREIAMDKTTDERAFRADILTPLTEYARFMDTISAKIGCRPPMAAMLYQPWNWLLLFKLYVGSVSPCQFRLVGPHAMPIEARRVIMGLPIKMGLVNILRLTVLGFRGFVHVYVYPIPGPAAAMRWLGTRKSSGLGAVAGSQAFVK